MARPKGSKQDINKAKYWLPNGIVCLDDITRTNKTTKHTFNDLTFGIFISTFYNIQKANASTHPEAVKQRRLATLSSLDKTKIVENRKKTMLAKYGVEHALKSKQFLDKSQNTVLKNYGVSNPAKSEKVKRKYKETCRNKYGVENTLFLPQAKQKMLEKHGVDNFSKLPEFYGKFKNTRIINKITTRDIDVSIAELRYIIYGLVDPDSKEIRYIGRSSTGLSRAWSHKTKCMKEKNNHKKNWIKSLLNKGKMYQVIVIANSGTPLNLGDLEQYWIAYYKPFGKLTNWAKGG